LHMPQFVCGGVDVLVDRSRRAPDGRLRQKKSSQVNVLVGFLPNNDQLSTKKLLITGEANINLKNALVRIENKTYGICRVTGKLIDKARLRAVPHATLSIEAKQMMSK